MPLDSGPTGQTSRVTCLGTMIAVNKDEPVEDLTAETPLPEVLVKCYPHILVLPDEFNKCIVGLSWDCNQIVYDVDKLIEVVIAGSKGSEYELSYDDAWEHFTFNIECAFPSGEGPHFIHTELPVIGLPMTKEEHANEEEKKSNNS